MSKRHVPKKAEYLCGLRYEGLGRRQFNATVVWEASPAATDAAVAHCSWHKSRHFDKADVEVVCSLEMDDAASLNNRSLGSRRGFIRRGFPPLRYA